MIFKNKSHRDQIPAGEDVKNLPGRRKWVSAKPDTV